MPRAVAGALVLWVIAGLTVFGGLSQRRRWAVPVEVLRMVALTAIGAWMGVMLGQFVVGAAASLALAVLSAFWVARYHNPRAT